LTTPLKNATKNQKYFLAQSIIKGRKNHAKEKRKKAGEEKIYQDGLNQTQ
jgi:hypothetical protein